MLTALLRDLDERLEQPDDDGVGKGHEPRQLRRATAEARGGQREAAAGLVQRDHDGEGDGDRGDAAQQEERVRREEQRLELLGVVRGGGRGRGVRRKSDASEYEQPTLEVDEVEDLAQDEPRGDRVDGDDGREERGAERGGRVDEGDGVDDVGDEVDAERTQP